MRRMSQEMIVGRWSVHDHFTSLTFKNYKNSCVKFHKKQSENTILKSEYLKSCFIYKKN